MFEKRKSIAAALAVALLAAACVATAWAQPCPLRQSPGEDGDGPDPGDRLVQRLGLTEEQAASVRRMREESQTERLSLRKEMMRLRHALRGEMLEDLPDLQEVERLSTDISRLQARIRLERLRGQIELRKLLTPEQRDKLLAMRGDRWACRDGERGPGRRGCCEQDGRGPGCGQGPGRGPRFAPPQDEDI